MASRRYIALMAVPPDAATAEILCVEANNARTALKWLRSYPPTAGRSVSSVVSIEDLPMLVQFITNIADAD
jgi:hypothetical protein